MIFSGGEAAAQTEFLSELEGTFYDMGISVALETCGYFDYEEVEDIHCIQCGGASYTNGN